MNTPAFTLIGTAAEMLFAHGQTTQATHRSIDRLAAALACPASLLMRWDETVLRSADGAQVWRSSASPTVVDMGLVAATEAVIEAVCDGRMGCAAACAALAGIRGSAGIPSARLAVMSAAGAVALAVIFGATDALTLLLIALSAGTGACLRKAVSRLSPNALLPPFLAALLAGAIGGVANLLDLGAAQRLIVVCPCMVLVPGAHLLNGSMDLVRGRLPLGSARIGFALLVILVICSGFLLGLGASGSVLPEAPAAAAVPLAMDVVAAGIAIAAYGSFFGMPWRLLPLPMAIGMLAHALRWKLLASGAGVASAAFLASLLVGGLVTPLAERLRMPFAALGFASVVSLIPGVYLFQLASGLIAAIHGSPPAAIDLHLVQDATTALVIAIGITAGLMLPRLARDAWMAGEARG